MKNLLVGNKKLGITKLLKNCSKFLGTGLFILNTFQGGGDGGLIEKEVLIN